jgi:NADPH:quinone reductase-like Zn-dependent oxidoreductase
MGAQVIAGVRGKELDDARALGVSDVLAIDDDRAIEKFRLADAITDTVGGEVAAKLIAKVKQNGSFGYTAALPENAAAQNPAVKITRVSLRSFGRGDSDRCKVLSGRIRLGREAEQPGDELSLADRIPFCQPSHSPLPDHVHGFDSL